MAMVVIERVCGLVERTPRRCFRKEHAKKTVSLRRQGPSRNAKSVTLGQLRGEILTNPFEDIDSFEHEILPAGKSHFQIGR
jgi:hypothetical protein